MANAKVGIDVRVTDGGTMKKLAKNTDKAGKSARSLDRNTKGAARASSNATKNFSKMSQGMGGLVGAYATLAASIFAISAAYEFFKKASDNRIMMEGQAAQSALTGIAYRALTTDLQMLTDGQLQFAEASQAAAIGLASGLSVSTLKELASIAKNVSLVLGRDLTDSFNRLIRGVTKAEPELLDELGIILRLKKATEDYGRAIGKSADDLNSFERTQAVAFEVTSQAADKFEDLNGKVNTFNQLGNELNEVMRSIQTAITPVAEFLAEVFITNTAAAAAAFALFSLSIIKSFMPSLHTIKEGLKKKQEILKQDQVDMKEFQDKAEIENKDRAERLKKQQKSSLADLQKTLSTKGLSKKSKSGVANLIYGNAEDNKKAEKSFKKQLVKALKQTKAGQTATAEGFKGMNRAQVLESDRAYKAMQGGTLRWKERTVLQFKIVGTKFAIMTNSMKGMWLSAMAAMAKAGAAAAAVMGFFATIGIIIAGIALAFGLLETAYDHAFRTEEQRKFRSEIKKTKEALVELNEEMRKAIEENEDTGIARAGFASRMAGNLSSKEDQIALSEDAEAAIKNAQNWRRKIDTILDPSKTTNLLFLPMLAANWGAKKLLGVFGLDNSAEALKGFGLQIDTTIDELEKSSFRVGSILELKKLQKAVNAGNMKEARSILASDEYKKEKLLIDGVSVALDTLHNSVSDLSKANSEYVNSIQKIPMQAQIKALEMIEGKFGAISDIITTGELTPKMKELVESMNLLTMEGLEIETMTQAQDALDRLRNSYLEIFYIKVRERDIQHEINMIIGSSKTDKTRSTARKNQALSNELLKSNIRLEENNLTVLYEKLRIAEHDKGIQDASYIRTTQQIKQQLQLIALGKQKIQQNELALDRLNELLETTAASFESSVTDSIFDLITNAESSLKDSLLGMAKNVATAAAKVLSETLADSLLGAFKFKTEAQKKREAAAKQAAEALKAAAEHAKLMSDGISGSFEGVPNMLEGALVAGGNSVATSIKNAFKEINGITSLSTDEGQFVVPEGSGNAAAFDAIKDAEAERLDQSLLDPGASHWTIRVDEFVSEWWRNASMFKKREGVNPTPNKMFGGGEAEIKTVTDKKIEEIAVESNKQSPDIAATKVAVEKIAAGSEKPMILDIADIAPEKIGAGSGDKKQGGYWSNIWGKTGKTIGAESSTTKGGMEELIVSGAKGTGIVGMFDDFTTNLGAVFDSQAQGGFLSKMGDLFMGLGSSLSGIFKSIFGGLGGVEGILGIFGLAKGGIAPGGIQQFAKGTPVIKRPTLALIGEGRMNEAVVPLPDGKSIPISGNMGNTVQNNITISIDAQGGTNTQSQGGQSNMSQLGKLLSIQVRETLVKEMRPGGLLAG